MNAPAASILVVDDEPDLRTLYELTLLREGYRVETASSVQEARDQLKAHRFDAVITDMRLPDGFGMELLQDLRDQQRRERCVVMTAYGSAENAVEALRSGAFDYLTKPVDLKQFRSVVASAVQGTGGVPAPVPPAAPGSNGKRRRRPSMRRATRRWTSWSVRRKPSATSSSGWPRSRAAWRRFSSMASQAPARSWWRRRCMPAASAPTAPWWP